MTDYSVTTNDKNGIMPPSEGKWATQHIEPSTHQPAVQSGSFNVNIQVLEAEASPGPDMKTR